MKQAILLSIKPEWLAKILNGEKTIEIRKTMPKCELPIDVYLYCTKDKHLALIVNQQESSVIYADNPYTAIIGGGRLANGFVVAKFTLKTVEDLRKYEWARKDDHFYDILKGACLTEQDLQDYCPLKNGETRPLWAWHISDLVIFDKPKRIMDLFKGITKAPQSWQYCFVEVSE